MTDFTIVLDDGEEMPLAKAKMLTELVWFESSAVEHPASGVEGWAVTKSADPIEKSAGEDLFGRFRRMVRGR